MTPLTTLPAPNATLPMAATADAGHPARETSAAPRPELGASAVVAGGATPSLDLMPQDRQQPEWSAAIQDPPPVKGLGIPALHTAKVGDLDQIDAAAEKPRQMAAPEHPYAHVLDQPKYAMDLRR